MYSQSQSRYSPMPELDSFSDSDWLDLASSRDLSDDNDSDSSQDSDRDDIPSPPHSRRSSISLGSSREGDVDVDAWEGFVDDSGDEALPAEIEVGMYPLPAIPLPPTADASESLACAIPASFIPDIEQPEEDERVREALEQSLVSTLSASRASTGGPASAHTSMRDLRLSFPDPLTSSRDELNRSYEDVSPSETAFSATDAEPEISTAAPLTPEQDPGLPPTTPAVPLRELATAKAGLDIILYGTSSPIKWSFVQDLVQKAANVSGHTLVNTLEFPNGPVQLLRLEKKADSSSTLTECIFVHDRTTDALSELNSDIQGWERPSLAIVYLPSARLPTLSLQHNAYLPVLAPTVHFTGVDLDAESDWDMLSSTIPRSKTLRFNESSVYNVFDGDDLEHTDPLHVYHALQGVIDDAKKPLVKSLAEQMNSRQAVTLFALMSLIMGFAINTAFRPSAPIPTPTIGGAGTSSLWGLFGPEANRSAIITTTTSSGSTALMPSSLKDLALSVFNPGTTSLSVTSQVPSFTSSMASSSKSAECKDCMSLTFSDRPRTSQDVIVHAAPTTPSPEVYTKVSVHVVPSTEKMDPRADPTSTALSLKTISSLSAVADQTMKAVVKVVSKDLQELMDAVDALMRAIQSQTHAAVQNGKGKARALGEHMHALTEQVQYRNNRARDRARELKRKGEQLMQTASETFMERTEIAKRRAKHLKQSFKGIKTETLRAYQNAHAEWVAKLREKGHGYASLHERRCRRRLLQGRVRKSESRGWKAEACDGFLDRL